MRSSVSLCRPTTMSCKHTQRSTSVSAAEPNHHAQTAKLAACLADQTNALASSAIGTVQHGQGHKE